MEETVTIKMTVDKAEALFTLLLGIRDEGPEGEGWQSEELKDFIDLLEDAITMRGLGDE